MNRLSVSLFGLAAVMLSCVATGQEQAVDGHLRLKAIGYGTPIPPRAGHWWAMPVEVENSSAQPQRAEVVAVVGGETRTEYSCALSLAAGQSQRQQLWLKFPEEARPGDAVPISVTLRRRTDRGEVVVHRAGQPVVQEVTVPLADLRLVTALLPAAPPPQSSAWAWRGHAFDGPGELVAAMRALLGLSPSTARFEADPLPIHPWHWQAIDNVVVQNDRPLRDLAACAAMRQWLESGGHAWIALDLIDPEVIEPLVGDLWRCDVVGQVELSRYAVGTKLLQGYATEPQVVERERPVRLVRVIQHGGEVTHTVDRWPALIRVPVGRGEVWLSTLSAAGWFRPEQPLAPAAAKEKTLEPWVPAFFGRFGRVPRRDSADRLESFPAAALVSYPVPSRAAVFGSLLAFLLATGLAGAWLSRRGQLQRIGWCVPLITIVVSAPLFASAAVRRRAVPDTIARIQFATVSPGAGRATIEEQGAVFLSRSRTVEMAFPAGAAYEPFPEDQGQVRYRLRTPQSDALRLHVDRWPAGLRGLNGRFQHPVGHSAALGHFRSDRLVIELPSSLPDGAADALLLSPPGQPWALTAAEENRFEMLVDESTEPGVRLADRLVSEDQRRHQSVYRELVAAEGSQRDRELRKPGIFVWTRPWPSPIQANHEFEFRGEALNRLHLRLVPPEPGTRIAVPSALLPLAPASESVSDPTVQEIVAGRAHIPATQPKQWSMVFRLPPETLPLDVESARFSVELQAPDRTVRIACVDGDRQRSWGSFDSPGGTVTRTLAGDDVVIDPQRGEIVVRFDVSPAAVDSESSDEDAEDSQPPNWQVRQPTLQVVGTVAGRDD